MKKLIHFLPKKIRENIYRKQVPANDYQKQIHGIEIKLATNQVELESAYQLLHDVYAGCGLMDPSPSGLRVNIFSTLPYTSVVVAKFQGQVVGTVSLIKDSPIGLPSDKEYLAENNRFRKQGLRLVEVSALAVHKSFRKKAQGSMVSFLLMRFILEYMRKHMGADMMVCTVHPRTRDFYSALFNYKQNGKIIKYPYVKNALAIHLSADLTNIESYLSQDKNLFNFFVADQIPKTYKFPKHANGLVLHPVMTPVLLEYFFIKKTKLFNELSRVELEMIKNAYELHFDMNTIEMFRFIKARRFGFRYQSELNASVISQDRIVIGKVFDLSPTGAFLQTQEGIPIGEKINFQITLDGQLHKIPAEVIRINSAPQNGYYPVGVGIKFLQESLGLTSALKNSHLNKVAA